MKRPGEWILFIAAMGVLAIIVARHEPVDWIAAAILAGLHALNALSRLTRGRRG